MVNTVMDSTGRQTNTALLCCCTQILAPSEDGCPACLGLLPANQPGRKLPLGLAAFSSLSSILVLISASEWVFGVELITGVQLISLCWGKNVVCKWFLHKNQNKVLFPNRNLLR